ncbi:MAG: NAD-dependent epimerase/dehydratase family protein [Gloeomargaritaceae cyanobacterium C42_A2020_066]|nr:NAD-dependent epimerase/dehydratase family protein [Gloeomargaritaceae cyanobacterium C42_A2020_066]
MGERVFVTGAAGFVGANLVRLLLAEGYTVRVLVRPGRSPITLAGLPVECVEGDLHSPDLVDLLCDCRYLFHVAAHYSLWRRDREELYRSNVDGTRNILSAARQASVERTVYTSSVAAIGVKPGQMADEMYQSPPEMLVGDYKKSKYWAEQVAHEAVAAGQDVVIVNPTTPIGAWDAKPTPTGDIILRFLQGRMPAYVDTGLNFVHVQDVAWGHLLALRHGKTGERYILGHQNMTLKDFLEQLAALVGRPAPRFALPVWLPLTVAWIDEQVLGTLGKTPSVPVDGVRMAQQQMYYNTDRAVRDLGLPQTPISEAILAAVHWFQTYTLGV